MVYSNLVIYVTRVYVVRHCETEGNAKKIFQGHINLPVNALGYGQLSALGKRFATEDIDTVFASPLLRTLETAKAVVGKRDIPIIPDEGLIEINGGDYEGKTFGEIGEQYPEFPEMWTNHPWDFNPPKGESMTDGYNRIWEAALRLARENDGKTIVLVTHGGVIRCLLCRALKDNIEKLTEIPPIVNTSVSLFEFGGELNVSFFNDSSHLTEDLINTKVNVFVGDAK